MVIRTKSFLKLLIFSSKNDIINVSVAIYRCDFEIQINFISEGIKMIEYAPGMRLIIRDEEWMIKNRYK